MKRLIASALVALMLVSCGSSKIVRQATRTFKGDWNLTTITYPGSYGTFDVTLLGEASAECFEGSSWKFVPNNDTGTYTINDVACSQETGFFKWFVDEVDASTGNYDFLLKPTDERYKSDDTNTGYRISLMTLTENDMVWEQTVSLDGKPFKIRWNFIKSIQQ
ncbi:lipocalin family protein [Gangjinia marincola]|uniref:Lipocalin family protein n=1 Tax=Gangjinia marincola TaxID=578463 RepID=A0ABP3XTJ4_9FLAO